MTGTVQLKRSDPETEGIPSSAVLDFIQAVEQYSPEEITRLEEPYRFHPIIVHS
jgi:hypothetical protein